MTVFAAFPNLKQYPGSINIHVEADKVMPCFDYAAMSSSTDTLAPFIADTIETTNPDGNPRHYAAANKTVYYYEDGTLTADHTFADVVTGLALVDNGSGTGVLLATFGYSSTNIPTNANATRDLTTDTTPWTTNAVAAGKAELWNVITVGPDAIGVTGSRESGSDIAQTDLGEYHVAKCPAGSDPTDSTLWGNVLAVGTPKWPIVSIVPFRQTFAVGKGDGLWILDNQTKIFFNALDRLKVFPHALNGKGMFAGENSVWYPCADGRIFEFDGVTARERTPTKSWNITRDVGQNRICAGADRGDVIALRTEPFSAVLEGVRASAAAGLKVITVTGATPTATDITSGVTDGKLSTPASANMGSWGAHSTDFLYVGSTQPIESVVLRVTRKPNSAVNSFTSPEYSDGAAGWPSLGDIRDGSILDTSGVSLALTGYPVSGASSVLSWSKPNAYDLEATETVAFGGSVGDVGPLYWVRFAPLTTTGMTSTTTIDEVDVIPCRGGLPNTGILTSSTNYSHRDRAGGLGKVIIGRRTGTGIDWQETYTVDDGGLTWAMGWTSARSGTTSNGGWPLLLFGRYQQTLIAEGINRDPLRTKYPMLVQPSSTKPAPTLGVRDLDANTMGLDPTQRMKLNLIYISGRYIQPTDKISVYFWWDNEDKIVELSTDYGSPGVYKLPTMYPSVGRQMNFDVVFSDASQSDPTAPYIDQILVDAESLGGDFNQYDVTRDSAFTTPESI